MQPETQGVNLFSKLFYLICLGFLLSTLQGSAGIRQLKSHWQKSVNLVATVYKYFNSEQAAPIVPQSYPTSIKGTPPLVMKGGDPYIRALMRTITASEANVSRPYNVIYGGKFIEDLSRHPEECVAIVAGPNMGDCSTAAGRYQMLNFTWDDRAKRYHPKPSGFWRWKKYSFEAKYQDQVVHDWLDDNQAWGVDIAQLLREGKIDRVLQMLSGTWTSLGYGIETNSMSQYLPQVYQNMLQEELQG